MSQIISFDGESCNMSMLIISLLHCFFGNAILGADIINRGIWYFFVKNQGCGLDCPSSKGNHAPHSKFERPNGKNTKSKIFLKSVQNWCLQLTWKFNEANSSKIWIKSKQIKINENQWHFWSFYILSLFRISAATGWKKNTLVPQYFTKQYLFGSPLSWIQTLAHTRSNLT